MKGFSNLLQRFNQFNQARRNGPKELPQQLGSHLITKMGVSPDHVWKLRCVFKAGEVKNHYNFRIFSPEVVSSNGIRIENFESLDAHAEMILYQGHFDKYSSHAVFYDEIDRPAA